MGGIWGGKGSGNDVNIILIWHCHKKIKQTKWVFFSVFLKNKLNFFKPTEGLIYKRKYHKCPSMRKQICIIDILIVKLKYHLSTLYQILPKWEVTNNMKSTEL